ncbi:MAG: nicotinate phosphoribosyltransferase, partial [Planctomycetota bacterium]
MSRQDVPADPYRDAAVPLLTDLYELTMAYGYWFHGRQEDEGAFHVTFRKHPFGGGYTVGAGCAAVIDLLQRFHFDRAQLNYLAGLRRRDGQPMFSRAFLDHLGDMRLACDIDVVPEGTVVFPHEPLVRVVGPLLQAQVLESALLNMVNFSTLIATKAARVCRAAEGDPVLEFGLRRSQGPDGALSAARATYIGGCSATSNVLAGMRYGIPVKGTHAHSWVMSCDDELSAFRQYAAAMPEDSVLLVDTYDSLAGVDRAITVARELRADGHELLGIRLDSGDLAWLSAQARERLDAAGFPEVKIVASGDLDEYVIRSLKQQGAPIDLWGVGTHLATAWDEPALGGVYKLAAVRPAGGEWDYRLKLSEQRAKISDPGLLQVRRFFSGDRADCDVIYDSRLGIEQRPVLIDPADPSRMRRPAADAVGEDLLVPV